LREYGYNFGIIFQLIDDLLDYGLQKPQSGKNLGRDFQEKTVTLPMILMYERATTEERERIRSIFSLGALNEEEFSFLKKMMKYYKIEKEILARTTPYVTTALRCLEGLPETREKEFLRNFISLLPARQN